MERVGTSVGKVAETDNQLEVMQHSEAIQLEKGDCVNQEKVVQLPEIGKVDFEQNDLKALTQVWLEMDKKKEFQDKYGNLAYLLFVPVDTPMLKAMLHFWDPSYRCFTFNQHDMTPTIEEYEELLDMKNVAKDKVYIRDGKGAKRQLSKIMDVKACELEKYMKEKGNNCCLSSDYLLKFIQEHINSEKGQAMLALAIYGLVIFPKVKGYIDGDVIKLFEKIQHHVNPIPTILAETIRSLNHCRREGKGRFHGCAQLLAVWMISHLPELSCFQYPKIEFKPHIYSDKNPLKEFSIAKWPRQTPTRSQWVNYFKELGEVVWRAFWMRHVPILYRCGEKPWVPLIGLWGVTSYAPAMVRRQLGSKQFIPITHGLSDMDFSYEEKDATQRIKEVFEAWKNLRRVEAGSCNINATPGYVLWQSNRGKGFIAPKVHGPEPPRQVFDEPIDYQAEAEARHEVMYRQLYENQIILVAKNKKLSSEKDVWATRATQAEKTTQELLRLQKEEAAKYNEELQKAHHQTRNFKEKCQTLKEHAARKDHENSLLRSDLQSLNQQLAIQHEEIQRLIQQNAMLQDDNYWYQRSTQLEEKYDHLQQQSNQLIENARMITENARKRAREAREIEATLPPSGAQRFLADVSKDFEHLGKFY